MTTRPRENMPDDVASAISAKSIRAAYDARPSYQRNDYLRWIKAAKREDTRKRRLAQMVDELRKGNIYMGSDWSGGEV